MNVHALVVEQLELDGTLRTLTMQASNQRKLIVALADEYDEPRSGPFHFLDRGYAQSYEKSFAKCALRRVGAGRFHRIQNGYYFETAWRGLPIERYSLSYYALSLPEFGIPSRISITDPHSLNQNYRKTVTRDDQRKRFVIYLGCRSQLGSFDFNLTCDFVVDPRNFPDASYQDGTSDQYGHDPNAYRWVLDEQQQAKVVQFFAGGQQVGDSYVAGQVGAMGRHATAQNNTFNQIWSQLNGTVELDKLSHELVTLRRAMRERATSVEHDISVSEVAKAEQAAQSGNGGKILEHLKSAGTWASDIAIQIGTDLVATVIAKTLGM